MEIFGGHFKFWVITWYLVKIAFISSALPWSNRLKASILRSFEATVGNSLFLSQKNNNLFPPIIQDFAQVLVNST